MENNIGTKLELTSEQISKDAELAKIFVPGVKVKKFSKNRFSSGRYSVTVKEQVISKYTGRLAVSFEEDFSIVDCHLLFVTDGVAFKGGKGKDDKSSSGKGASGKDQADAGASPETNG